MYLSVMASDHKQTDNSFASEDAFHSLADETRLRILQVLAEAGGEAEGGRLSYSELQRRVGVTDSGKFNYHLSTLVDSFVLKEDEGYQLRFTGHLVHRAITAGTFGERPQFETVELETACYECGAALTARYCPGHLMFIDCSSCGSQVLSAHFPPRGLESRTPDELLEAVNQRERHEVSLISRGVCPWCAGQVETRLVSTPESIIPSDGRPLKLYFTHTCAACHGFHFTTVGETLLTHPAVIGFYYDHGIDFTETYLWEHEFVVTDHNTETLSRPLEDCRNDLT